MSFVSPGGRPAPGIGKPGGVPIVWAINHGGSAVKKMTTQMEIFKKGEDKNFFMHTSLGVRRGE
jgi:hypothetical protein